MIFTKPPRRLSGYQAYAEKNEGIPLLEVGEIKARSDWKVPPHSHPGFEVHLQWKGITRWRAEGSVFQVPENGAYLIHPGVRHTLVDTGHGDVHFTYVVFPATVVPRVLRGRPPFAGGYFAHDRAHRLATPLQEIQREVSRRGRHRAPVIRSYLEILCYGLAGLGDKPPLEQELAAHPASLLARELMDGRPEEDWNLTKLATLCGISVPHLVETFHRDFGYTPRQYLLAARLRIARLRLATTAESVTTIAIELGFSSGQHLARAYRKMYGESARGSVELRGQGRVE